MAELAFLEQALLNTNVQAFMKTIRQSEGTDAPDGYTYLFGSSSRNSIRFNSFATHPHIEEPFGKQFSSAAGAYQIMYPTWQDIEQKLSLPDFSPHSQDIACLELLSEKDCVQKLMDGDFSYVLTQAASIWASLPGNTYGQPEHSVATVTQWYIDNGGAIAA